MLNVIHCCKMHKYMISLLLKQSSSLVGGTVAYSRSDQSCPRYGLLLNSPTRQR
ncbi:hypothetical protein AAFF_G00098900, partial [Aldrovandia affinis]